MCVCMCVCEFRGKKHSDTVKNMFLLTWFKSSLPSTDPSSLDLDVENVPEMSTFHPNQENVYISKAHNESKHGFLPRSSRLACSQIKVLARI